MERLIGNRYFRIQCKLHLGNGQHGLCGIIIDPLFPVIIYGFGVLEQLPYTLNKDFLERGEYLIDLAHR